ncbi:hypothetical protein NDN08_005547 [Rhodosorus marinus]|uniref:Transmembrane protein 14C n=1 Tax=Rhodosorus marinus TaxID=101924 RepID=A0AAV8V4J1_9RHOD|nr:hypothetical protein NDN08_005547 [Rhodosorus marinus]
MGGEGHIANTMGAITILGGCIAYARKRSIPSLAGSLPIGLGFLASAYAINNGHEYEGHLGAFGCSCVLIAAMAPRAARAGRITPGAIISFIALGAAAYEGEKAKQWAP